MKKGPNKKIVFNNPIYSQPTQTDFMGILQGWISSHYILVLTSVAGLVIAGLPGAIGFGLATFAIELKFNELQNKVKSYNPFTYLSKISNLFSFDSKQLIPADPEQNAEQVANSGISFIPDASSCPEEPLNAQDTLLQRGLNNIRIVAGKLCGGSKRRSSSLSGIEIIQQDIPDDDDDNTDIAEVIANENSGNNAENIDDNANDYPEDNAADFYEEIFAAAPEIPQDPEPEDLLDLESQLKVELELQEYEERERKKIEQEQSLLEIYETDQEISFITQVESQLSHYKNQQTIQQTIQQKTKQKLHEKTPPALLAPRHRKELMPAALPKKHGTVERVVSLLAPKPTQEEVREQALTIPAPTILKMPKADKPANTGSLTHKNTEDEEEEELERNDRRNQGCTGAFKRLREKIGLW